MNKYSNFIKRGLIIGLAGNLFCSPILAHAADWRYSNGTTGFQQQEKPAWCWVASARLSQYGQFVKKLHSDVNNLYISFYAQKKNEEGYR